MKTSKQVLLNVLHGCFLGFAFGMTAAILTNEFYPEIEAYLDPAFIFPIFVVFGAIIGFIKGYHNKTKLLHFLFSTAGTILIPLILFSIVLYFIGLDRILALPPVLFKTGIGLKNMDTQLSTYILAAFLTLSILASFISSLSINKKKRWTW